MSGSDRAALALALIGLAIVVIDKMTGVIPPFLGWPIVAGCLIGALVLIVHGQRARNAKQKQELSSQGTVAIRPQEGSLDSVTMQDRDLILSWSLDMLLTHGHRDERGLLADRASGIPLNKLMEMPCSDCGEPRNKRGK